MNFIYEVDPSFTAGSQRNFLSSFLAAGQNVPVDRGMAPLQERTPSHFSYRMHFRIGPYSSAGKFPSGYQVFGLYLEVYPTVFQELFDRFLLLQ